MDWPRFSSYQTRVLWVLTLINFVNYVDRQVLYPLFPLIGEEFHVGYARLGLLATAFSIVHSFGALGLGRVADRASRKKVISYGIFLWSSATVLGGLAKSFTSLLTARALVGVGEAAYTPAATAMISGSFAHRIRARVQGVFDLGMYLGGAMGLALGGLLADRVGWRPAFFVVGLPGLLLALSARRLPEPPPALREEQVPLRHVLRVPAYVMVLIGGWFLTFAAHSYIAWGPTFVHQYKGFSLAEAGVTLGAMVVVAGFLGILAGAALADRLARGLPWGRAVTVAIGFLIAAPLILMALRTTNKLFFVGFFFLGMFFASWYHGPVTAVIHDLIPACAHATAMGVYYFFVNLFATVPAFWMVGMIADRYSLLTGMYTALAAHVAGGLCFLVVVYLIRRHGLHHPAMAPYREGGRMGNGERLASGPGTPLQSSHRMERGPEIQDRGSPGSFR